MAGLAGAVGSLLGVQSPSTQPYGLDAERLKQQQQQYGAREAQNYGQEQNLAGSLGSTIAGTAGPSVAQTQLQQGLDTSNADAMAAGAGASGQNAVLARFQARQQAGEQAARMQQAAAILRAQEVAQAQQQLAQLRAAMGGQSIGLYGANLQGAMSYDQLKAQMDQQNAQRNTILGAAGLSGLGQLGASYFGSQGGQGGGGGGGGLPPGMDGRGDNLLAPSF